MTTKSWLWLHRWSSLVCTLFLLVLCITGLPLIFHHEIAHLTGQSVKPPPMKVDTPMADLDTVTNAARTHHPGLVVQFLYREPDEPNLWWVSLADTPTASENVTRVAVDARTALVLATPNPEEGFLYWMYRLHSDCFAGLPGKLLLGVMGILLVIAMVSGVVLYKPFGIKPGFGIVRRGHSARTKWLDRHNLLGMVIVVWLCVVGFTGVINTWADLLIRFWQYHQMTAIVVPWKDIPPPTQVQPVQRAVTTVQTVTPEMMVGLVAFPGTMLASPHHYAVLLRGTAPFASRLYVPYLIEAESSAITARVDLPWYMTVLLVSQPLHFGDYSGLPLKLLWGVLDMFAIIVLGSGLFLYAGRFRNAPSRNTNTGDMAT